MLVSLSPLPTDRSTDVAATMVAHQGGWDEMLMVAVPILIFALLLRAANRRASRLSDEATSGDQLADEDASTAGGRHGGTRGRRGAGADPSERGSGRAPRNPRAGPI